MKHLLLLLFVISSWQATAQQTRTIHRHHKFRYSEGRTIKTENVEHGKREVRRWGNFELTVNTDYSTGRMKAQHVNYGKKWSIKATYISTGLDSITVDTVLTSSLVCQNFESPDSLKRPYKASASPVPVPLLYENNSAQYVFCLWFYPYRMNNANWWPRTLNCAQWQATDAQIRETFARVAEKGKPFNYCLTTDTNRYNAAKAVMINGKLTDCRIGFIVITQTDSVQQGMGGISFVSSARWLNYQPCFAFPKNLANTPEYIADAVIHELTGHEDGLVHHGDFNSNCNLSNGYMQAHGAGQLSFAAVMGAGYGAARVLWYKGSTNGATCSTSLQDDLAVITTGNGFGYRADDIQGAGKIMQISNNMFSDSGLIEKNSDRDTFQLNVGAGQLTVNLKGWAWNYTTGSGNCLKPVLRLLDASGNLLSIDTPTASLAISRTISVNAATYFAEVSGGGNINAHPIGSTGQWNYGSLGTYYISGTTGAPRPPTIIISGCPTVIWNGSQGNTLIASGALSYKWSTGATGNQIFINPQVTTTYSVTGTDAIGLTGNASCIVNVIPVNPCSSFSISISPLNPSICLGNLLQITASGATSFTWQSSSASTATSAPSINVAPNITTTYTVTGTNTMGCTATAQTIVTVLPNPKITIQSNVNNPVCKNSNVTLTASGAQSYSWYPSSGILSSSLVVSPSIATSYVCVGTDANGCTSSASYLVVVMDCSTSTCAAKIISLGSGSKAVYVYWNKPTALGIYVQYKTDSTDWTDYPKQGKPVLFPSTPAAIQQLRSGTKYYVRIREQTCTSWSDPQSVITR